MTVVLSNEDVEAVLTMPACIDAMEVAYRALAEGQGVNGPVYQVMVPLDPDRVPGAGRPVHHALSSMAGAIGPLGVACERVDSDGIHYFEAAGARRKGKLPLSRGESFCGLVILWDVRTGEPLAFIHDAVLQKTRVAATAALGTRHLARPDAASLALIGTGWQAGAQIQAHAAVRRLREVRVYSPNPEHRRAFAARWAGELGIPVRPTGSAEEAVRGADIVATATNSIDPVVPAEWISPGAFLTGVKDTEFADGVYRRCDRIFVNRAGPLWQRFVVEGGEAIPEEGRSVFHRGVVDWSRVPLLGQVICGQDPGRRSAQEVLMLVNWGDGIQFAAIGERVYRSAVERGLGRRIPTEWFLQGREYVP